MEPVSPGLRLPDSILNTAIDETAQSQAELAMVWRRSCSTETGCGSETSSGCSSTQWFKLSERARVSYLSYHFNSEGVSLMLPLAGSAPSRLPVAGYQAVITDTWGFHPPSPTRMYLTWSLSPGATDLLDLLDRLCPGCGQVFLFFTIRRNPEDVCSAGEWYCVLKMFSLTFCYNILFNPSVSFKWRCKWNSALDFLPVTHHCSA